ncbi:DUF7861 family protein [Haloplanus natans]
MGGSIAYGRIQARHPTHDRNRWSARTIEAVTTRDGH